MYCLFKIVFVGYLNKERLCYCNMGRWRCSYCDKVIEGESFMTIVKATLKDNEPIHAWKNIVVMEPEKSKLLA